MKIIVGSTNPTKIDAVRKAVLLYSFLKNAEVAGITVASGVSDQPKTIEETIRGAVNRARNAYNNCDYSIGLESGLHDFPVIGYMDLTACIAYDGQRIYSGLSPAISLPQAVIDLVLEKNVNLNDASREAGLTSNQELGKNEGFVGVLTKNRINRLDYTMPAIIFALSAVEQGMGKELK